MSDIQSDNVSQREHWNSVAGPKWIAFGSRLDRHLHEIGQLLLRAASPRSGESVLDIGCGTGAMLVPLATAVGPKGSVVGVDISASMLAAARGRIDSTAIGNITLVEGDAQVHAFDCMAFDLLVSRFGVMFFVDPVVAFRNLLRVTRANGRLCFVCWAPLQENPHWSLALGVAGRWLGAPDKRLPRTPGPLAFSNVPYVEEILQNAGFAEIKVSPQSTVLLGTSPEEEAEFLCTMGPAAALIAERKPAAGVITSIRDELARALGQFVHDGQMMIPASVFLVQAQRAN